ncbi:TRM11 family SAM-dependent methyltransferase [Tsuneonella rigui]|uniref:TRM11 family SAM-dependent methyltransferase n=1 Tax=Tsuneonella rigui TaxID=1708790 RepID=UPI000F7F2367|nr:DNA methyltransferase [Tsuneonella rigui]
MTVSVSSQLPLDLADDDTLFVLDGRMVRFPEGLRTGDFTHTIHRFPGKFVPQVARELIRLACIEPGSGVLCDPFCGSGTTLVEAATIGIESVGLDFDPLGVLISKVKTTPLSMEELVSLDEHWRWAVPRHGPTPLAPDVPKLSHWFLPEHVSQLSAIKARCLQLPERLRDFSLVVFSSIIRRVSNADDQTQKTYVSGTLPKRPPEPRQLFPIVMARAIAGMSEYSVACRAQPRVRRADAREKIGEPVHGVVTSPPYLDSIDYVYNQMLEYFWLHEELGMAQPSEIRTLRSLPMGFSRGMLRQIIDEIGGISANLVDALSSDLSAIEATSRKEAEHVAGYFRDYATHLRAFVSFMPAGARYTLAIGESVVRGRRIATPDLLVPLFEASGFRLVGRCAYEIRRHYMKFPRRSNSGMIRFDHILCFEKA